MKTISAKRLEAAGACTDQVRLFRDTFGDKPVRINAENWAKAGEVGLDRLWLERFLKGAARAEYDRVRGPAWAEYDRVHDAALAEYVQTLKQISGDHRAILAAQDEYRRAHNPAFADYLQAQIAALFEALTKG